MTAPTRTPQPLTQHEGVLRPDRHDERESGQQSTESVIKHGWDARRAIW